NVGVAASHSRACSSGVTTASAPLLGLHGAFTPASGLLVRSLARTAQRKAETSVPRNPAREAAAHSGLRLYASAFTGVRSEAGSCPASVAAKGRRKPSYHRCVLRLTLPSQSPRNCVITSATVGPSLAVGPASAFGRGGDTAISRCHAFT